MVTTAEADKPKSRQAEIEVAGGTGGRPSYMYVDMSMYVQVRALIVAVPHIRGADLGLDR